MIDVTPSVPNIVSKSARGFLFNWTKLPVAFNSFVIQFELNPFAVVDNSRICFEARSRGEKKSSLGLNMTMVSIGWLRKPAAG